MNARHVPIWGVIAALLFPIVAAAQDDRPPPRVILPPEAKENENDSPRGAGVVAQCRPKDRTPERVRVLLMDLNAAASKKRLARTLGQAIADEAARVPGFKLLSTDELRAILDNDAQKAIAGCTDSECLADLASALDADLLISGSLDARPGAPVALTLSLVNTRALVTVNRVIMTWPGDADLLPELARTAAQRLVFEGSMRKPGLLYIENLPEGGTVAVDDVDFSGELEDETLILPVGPYRIRLSAPDHESVEIPVLIQADEETVVDGALTAIESSATMWWVIGSVSVLAALVTTGLVATAVVTGGSSVTADAEVGLPTLADAEAAR